jgi:hypothetical protein
MCDEWMPTIQLPLTREYFAQLPRHPAYRYELLGGAVCLSPRPKHYHALLDLHTSAPPEEPAQEVVLRPVLPLDWEALVPVFAASFDHIQPFGSLDNDTRLLAARKCLERTCTGGDGPWIDEASFVAISPGDEQLIGAILVTLLPNGDPCDWDSYSWNEAPPPDCIRRRLGRPHLTWIFVTPFHAGNGVGSVLLTASRRALLALGFQELLSTFMIGNDSSMLWHWRNGFRLLAYPASRRLQRQRRRQQSW